MIPLLRFKSSNVARILRGRIVPSGYVEPIHLLNLSSWIAQFFGGNLVLGEAFASLLIAGIFILICIGLRSQLIIVMSIGMMVLMALTAIGWIPVYTWILVALYLAITLARNYKGLF
jgi:hypothetical protein